jgi:signal transduction histidine kinase
MGRDVRAWPMLALLLLIVLVAIGCVLWFMRAAMQNERMAVRQKLADAYRGQLGFVHKRVDEQWRTTLAQPDGAETGAALFARAVRERWADSVICFSEDGRVIYPQIDGQGRIAEANAELLALENEPANPQLAARLRARVLDYSGALPAAQRRFLMREMQRLVPGETFPTLAAEDLSARWLDAHPGAALPDTLRPANLPGVWQAASPGRHVILLFETATLRAKLDDAARDPALPAGVRVNALAPSDDAADATLVAVPLGAALPGWRLALSLDDRASFDTAAEQRATRHLLIGSVVTAAMLVLALLIARSFGRQVRLTRLKNDLVANVSHELKTPLSAMRALVDTLLDTERFDEKTTREYLQLLSTENARLSRLIDNFLTFSRLERDKFRFQFAPLRPEVVVDEAVAALGERARAAGCTFETHTAQSLPAIQGDRDALVTALLNLLDNAWKYSGDEKRITLRTEARNGSVLFRVQDNGVGLTPRQSRAVFDRFHQADNRLSRAVGGCGLGLSIVRSIATAHRGRVEVESEPGRGSTFTLEIPTS